MLKALIPYDETKRERERESKTFFNFILKITKTNRIKERGWTTNSIIRTIQFAMK